MLIVPQGFTLAVAGSVTICVGRHGFPGPVGVWLFVAGAAVGYWLVVAIVGALGEPVHQPVGIVGLARRFHGSVLVRVVACREKCS